MPRWRLLELACCIAWAAATTVGQQGPTSAHWSLSPPRLPAVPAVRQTAWPRHDLDRFVLARLEQQGLAPSPEADRATWSSSTTVGSITGNWCAEAR